MPAVEPALQALGVHRLEPAVSMASLPGLAQRRVCDLGPGAPESALARGEVPVLDRLLERGRDLLAHARLLGPHHPAPREQVGVRWLEPRAVEQLPQTPPGVRILGFPGTQQFVGVLRAGDLGVACGPVAEPLERPCHRVQNLALVLERGEELARQRVPGEQLHVVAAQQQRTLAFPAHPLERRLGGPPAVAIPLPDHRERVAQSAFADLDWHSSAGQARGRVGRERAAAALVLASAATPAPLVATRRPASSRARVALGLDERRARATIS